MDSVWKDPDTFRPERWLDALPPSDVLCSGWSNTLAFSDGPRNCIGYRLGASPPPLPSLCRVHTLEMTR